MHSPGHYVDTLLLNALSVGYVTGVTAAQIQSVVAVMVGVSIVVLNAVKIVGEIRRRNRERTED